MAKVRKPRVTSRPPQPRRGIASARVTPARWLRFALHVGGGVFVLICLFAAYLSGWSYWSKSTRERSESFRVEEGESTASLAERLAEANWVGSSWLMEVYLATLGNRGDVARGGHWLPARATPRLIAACLSREARRPVVEVLFPEGFDHVRAAQRLEERGVCEAERFIAVVRDRGILDRLAITGPDAEGYVFPATYRLNIDADPEDLLYRFVAETRSRMRKIDARLGGGMLEKLSLSRGWGEREILTLASMIEKEAGNDEERPLIASVFFNRLDSSSFRPKRMLQSDPTAGYGCLLQRDTLASCRDYKHKILPAMLRDPKNPYNTYRHPGLPPGPIASPGEASIESVLKPASTDFLFFVAVGNGRHQFSRTLDEHEARFRGEVEP